MNKFAYLTALAAVTLTGCTLAPKYERPAAPVSTNWPADAAVSPANSSTNAVADIGWREFFQDPRLQAVIGLALTNNRDLRVATLNVERARAQYRIQRGELLPQIGGNGSFRRERKPVNDSGSSGPPGSPIDNQYDVNLGTASYELDLFGRVRSLKNVALENYFSTQSARQSAQIALVAEVANQYLTERELASQLKMTQDTLCSVTDAYRLIKASFDAGSASELDLRTAEAQVAAAKANAAAFEQQRDQARHALVLLVGEPLPADLPPPQPLDEQHLLTDLPPGLPSDLLQRRPDILAAEHTLKAANADIGAARAAFFPTISLTADAGFSSSDLAGLFVPGSRAWLFNPQITVPIFSGGRARANLDAAKLSKRIEVANYEKAIQTAFREVADALTAKKFLAEQLADNQALVAAEQRRYELADARYQNGVDSYLAVLSAQQDLFSARQNLIATQFDRLANLVALYQALGGGWQETSATAGRE